MNKIQILIVLVLSSMVFTSCMKISKKNSEAKTEQSAPVPEPVLTPQAQVEIQKKPGVSLDYDLTDEGITFQFPTSWPETIFVEVVDQEQRITIPLILNPENKTWNFKWPGKDRKFGFIFRSQLDKKAEALKEIEVLPPLIVKTSQNVDLVATYRINSNFEKIVFQQLHLLKGAQIFLKTFTGQVIINELYSEAGTVQTFPTNDKASVGTPGLSGGRVEFKINSGEGHLSLAALGQHGGDGSAGAAPDESLRGRQGEPGHIAEFGEPNYCNPSSSICFNPTYPCLKNPTDSSPGYQGLKGYRGYPGQSGGNSGLYSVLSSATSVKTNIIAKEGKGGHGGAGGAGGEGGYGGEIGDGDKMDLLIGKFKFSKERAAADRFNSWQFDPACKPGRVGQKGPKGPEGDFGLDGLDGVNEILTSK